MLRYTLLRTLVFFGCLLVGWLAGLRGQENLIPLVLVAAIASMVISYFALRRFREDYSRQIDDKLQERAERKQHLHGDEAAEDAEDEGHPTYR